MRKPRAADLSGSPHPSRLQYPCQSLPGFFMRTFSFLAAVAFLFFVAALDRPARAAEQEYPELLVARTDPLPPEAEQKKFHLPPGFEIELVVSEPQIHKPMNLNFDERGRLFVTNSLEYPFPKKPGERGRDQVTVLSQFDAHGKAGQAMTLVDGLNICIGVTPVADGVIYYSIPKISKGVGLEGTVPEADRKVLYSTFGFRDTHGMTNSFTRWIDGWIYACHGFSN